MPAPGKASSPHHSCRSIPGATLTLLRRPESLVSRQARTNLAIYGEQHRRSQVAVGGSARSCRRPGRNWCCRKRCSLSPPPAPEEQGSVGKPGAHGQRIRADTGAPSYSCCLRGNLAWPRAVPLGRPPRRAAALWTDLPASLVLRRTRLLIPLAGHTCRLCVSCQAQRVGRRMLRANSCHSCSAAARLRRQAKRQRLLRRLHA